MCNIHTAAAVYLLKVLIYERSHPKVDDNDS